MQWIGLISLFVCLYCVYRQGRSTYEDDHNEIKIIDESLAKIPALNRYHTRYSKIERMRFMAELYQEQQDKVAAIKQQTAIPGNRIG